MTGDYAECQKIRSNAGSKTDGCLEFAMLSLSNPLVCKTCGCRQNYHRKVIYTKCNKIHDLKIPNSVDGCQKFFNSSNRQCAACGCHKGFHQNDTIATKEVVSTSRVKKEGF
ncbi:hypothetical protein ABFX02_10G120000 [Erythranthe guttata]